MVNVPITAYVTINFYGVTNASRIITLNDRLAVYNSVDEALRDEHKVVSMCQQTGKRIALVVVSQAHIVLKLDGHGRISGRKKADTVTGTKSGS